jgi:NTP pyrophosphatase (non-canonical NTP hydrolase)
MTSKSMKDLITLVDSFIREREWTKYHTPKNLAMSIAIEAAEIMELFQWLTNEESVIKMNTDSKLKRALEDELADVMIYCLSMSNSCKIDITTAILRKLDLNKKRFPPAIVSGRLGPYSIED